MEKKSPLLSPPKKNSPCVGQTVSTADGGTEIVEGIDSSQLSGMSFLKRKVFSQFCNIQYGQLTVRENGHATTFGKRNGLSGEITIHSPRCYRHLAFGGAIGAAESFIEGGWSTPDLINVIRLFARNENCLRRINHGLARLKQLYYWTTSRLHPNSRKGSRKNIAAHYDLGNDFFSLFLDSSMTYSCGIFDSPESSLLEASMQKYRVIAEGLDLSTKDRVIEIGSGWGGFAFFVAENYGCHITTTTISKKQFDYVSNKVREANLTEKITVVCKDYRDLEGTFDKLASIEMIEAVGHRFLKLFFKKCGDLLKPQGKAMIQAITVPDNDYSRYRRSTDFIQQFIFPGGCLPSVQAIKQATDETELRVVDVTNFSNDYVRTLLEWRTRFFDNLTAIKNLSFGEQFVRLWDYYLCYCAGGFAEGKIQVGHISFKKTNHTVFS
jgi:cyclopropane-fatty-acyl-phospholipid synthase